jgi:hypothetical protein
VKELWKNFDNCGKFYLLKNGKKFSTYVENPAAWEIIINDRDNWIPQHCGAGSRKGTI